MKKKKRYILLRLEKAVDLYNFSDIKVISNVDSKAIVSCELSKLSDVIFDLEKECKIVTVSGTLKALRSSV
ncbi:MAG: hypothetical protein WDZ43_04795 [Nitrosopumilaceae archaeon]